MMSGKNNHFSYVNMSALINGGSDWHIQKNDVIKSRFQTVNSSGKTCLLIIIYRMSGLSDPLSLSR